MKFEDLNKARDINQLINQNRIEMLKQELVELGVEMEDLEDE